jgi:hypothetical protein
MVAQSLDPWRHENASPASGAIRYPHSRALRPRPGVAKRGVMAKPRFGGLPPRYSFILNPYVDTRLSKCPLCDRPTHPRKFALFIHVDNCGPLVLGKTCRYCTRCELIVAHQDEVEAEMAQSLGRIAPEAVGGEYLVLGTMDRKLWQQGLRSGGTELAASLEHVAEFRRVFDLKVEGGWGPG